MTSSVNSSLVVYTPSVSKKWCYTEQKFEKFSYKWTINNLRFCFDNNKYFDSPYFSFGANKISWHLRFEELTMNEKKIYKLYVFFKSVQGTEAKAKFKFCIESSEPKIIVFESEEIFVVDTYKRQFSCALGDEFKINKLPKDKITICCKIIVFEDRVNISGESNVAMPECKLMEDFGKLLDDKKFTDLILIADGHKFQAHKCILAARSAVFAAMFEHDFKELEFNCVDITDIQPVTLREMLTFIYTGKVPNLNEMAKDLFIAADKYALEKLKAMCEETLSATLSVETAVETLIFSDRYSAKQFKANTLAFIAAHANAVMKTPEWQKMIKTHAHLIAEGFQALAAQKTETKKDN